MGHYDEQYAADDLRKWKIAEEYRIKKEIKKNKILRGKCIYALELWLHHQRKQMGHYDDYARIKLKEPTKMDFSEALKLVKAGKRVQRQGWNGKDMFIFLVPGSVFKVNREPLLSIFGFDTTCYYHAHIDMRTANGQIVPWLCSQTDMLAEDWVEV